MPLPGTARDDPLRGTRSPTPSPTRYAGFRGRLGGAVTLWTTGAGGTRAGLTVSSLMVADGEPAQVLALVDPDSDFREALARGPAAGVVQVLAWEDRALAEMFAGTAPAPGGAFAHGGVRADRVGPAAGDGDQLGRRSSLGRRAGRRVVGRWSLARLEEARSATIDDAAGHRRGRYGPAWPGSSP